MVPHGHPPVAVHAPFSQEGGVLHGVWVEGYHVEPLPVPGISDSFVGAGWYTLGFQEWGRARVCESVAGFL